MTYKIKVRAIGTAQSPYIVATLSGNHNSVPALDTTDAAVRVGAVAIKLQTRTADMTMIDCDRPEFPTSDHTLSTTGHGDAEVWDQFDE